MKKHLTNLLSMSLLFGMSSAASAMDCGPHFTTYKVKTHDPAVDGGIRCVQFQYSDQHLVWYGEGFHHSNLLYRHIGRASLVSGSYVGSAADIHGNGEHYASVVREDLRLVLVGAAPSPVAISVSSAWNEVWQRVDIGMDYQSRLAPVAECGPNFDQFKVSDRSGLRAGGGVRCHIGRTRGFGSGIWFGRGDWDGRQYAHLGFSDPRMSTAGASDLFCLPGAFCNNFAMGSILLTPYSGSLGTGYEVTRGWNEYWIE